jgi:DNA-directed RNA polymerase specialized sigma24 family protein
VLTDAQLEQLEAGLPAMYPKLVARAAFLLTGYRPSETVEIARAGVTAEDIAQQALLALVSGDRPAPTQHSLWTVLKVIIRSLVSNAMASGAAREVPLDEMRLVPGKEGQPSNAPLEYDPGPEAAAADEERRAKVEQQILDVLFADPEGLAISRAILDGHRKPSDIAEHLGMEVKAVNNAYKRLRRSLQPLAKIWRSHARVKDPDRPEADPGAAASPGRDGGRG